MIKSIGFTLLAMIVVGTATVVLKHYFPFEKFNESSYLNVFACLSMSSFICFGVYSIFSETINEAKSILAFFERAKEHNYTPKSLVYAKDALMLLCSMGVLLFGCVIMGFLDYHQGKKEIIRIIPFFVVCVMFWILMCGHALGHFYLLLKRDTDKERCNNELDCF